MRHYLAIPLVLLSACSSEWTIIDSPWPVTDAEEAVYTILDHYRGVVGDEAVDAALSLPLDLVFRRELLEISGCSLDQIVAGTYGDGCIYRDGEYTPIYHRSLGVEHDRIVVSTVPGIHSTIGETALAHELLHLVLYVDGRGGDYSCDAPDRDDAVGARWQAISDTAAALADDALGDRAQLR